MKARIALICGSSLIAVSVAWSAEFSGFPINYETLPQEARQRIPIDVTTDDFKARLKSGGTLVLDGNETVIGQPSRDRSAAFLALDTLELKNGAKIVTNGNYLTIFVNKLISHDGAVVSFTDQNPAAGAGEKGDSPSEAGQPGEPGLGGGVVSIHVIDTVEGRLNVDLHGQNGGDGGPGAPGSKGTTGSRGTDAQDGPGGWLTPGWCKRGGSNGGAGGKGFPGGAGGPGGPGGDGGFFQLISVGAAPLPEAVYSFSGKGGSAGKNASGGEGGSGGDGGDGGHGSTWCGGGHGGPTGPKGDQGTTLDTPPPAGGDGKSEVKNLDIEVIVRAAVVDVSLKQP